MEYLKKVLIREVDGSKEGDKVFYIENLPKSLLYKKELKQIIDYTDVQNRQRWVPDFEINDRGQKIPTRAMEDVLLSGLRISPNDDQSVIFDTQYNEPRAHLQAIDRYIQQSVPVFDRVPKRIPYAMQPGVMTSGPIALSTIPCVVLPEPASPPVKAEQILAPAEASVKRPKRAMTAEHKAKIQASLKLARERKAAQKA